MLLYTGIPALASHWFSQSNQWRNLQEHVGNVPCLASKQRVMLNGRRGHEVTSLNTLHTIVSIRTRVKCKAHTAEAGRGLVADRVTPQWRGGKDTTLQVLGELTYLFSSLAVMVCGSQPSCLGESPEYFHSLDVKVCGSLMQQWNLGPHCRMHLQCSSMIMLWSCSGQVMQCSLYTPHSEIYCILLLHKYKWWLWP